MLEKLKGINRELKGEIRVYKAVFRDHRTPLLAKLILGLALGYLILPFDVIPDFIPVVGEIDDAIIVPCLIMLALKLIPPEVISDCKKKTY